MTVKATTSNAATANAPYRPFGAFRLALAVLVAAQHILANCAPARLAEAAAPYEVGSLAVLVFFVLSGTVICEAADLTYRGRPAPFLANRLLRIVPHYLAAIAAMILVLGVLARYRPVRLGWQQVLDPDAAFGAQNLLANLLGFLPFSHLAMREDLLPIAWAVRIEMMFYLVVAAILLAGTRPIGRSMPRWLGRPSFAAGAGLAAAALTPPYLVAMLRGAPAFLQLVPYFVLGGALYLAQARGSRIARAVAVAACAGIAWEFAARPIHHPTAGFDRAVPAQALLLAGLLALFAVLPRWRAGRFARLDRSLGDLSYPLYIWHGLAVLTGLALGAETSAWSAPAVAALALTLAILAHRLIDPRIDRLRDLIRGRRLRTAGSASRSATDRAEGSGERAGEARAAPV